MDVPTSPSLSAMSTATVSILGGLNLDDVIGVKAGVGCVEIHSLPREIGCCGKPTLLRQLYTSKLSVARFDVDAVRVASELSTILAGDVLARMESVGTLPRLVDGLPVRKILVIYNPHSGKNKAGKLFDRHIKPLLDIAGVQYDKFPTQYSKHAINLGREHDPTAYEGVMFISGDGTVKEFLEGITQRTNWYNVICRTPICSVSSGTANALAVGLRSANPIVAAYCVIKHLVRPCDAILIVPPTRDRILLSLCGTGWGVPGDIAAESESCRRFGTARYCLLKVKRGALCPKDHTGGALYSTSHQPFVLQFLSRAVKWSEGVDLPRAGPPAARVDHDGVTVITLDSGAHLMVGDGGIELAGIHAEGIRSHSPAPSFDEEHKPAAAPTPTSQPCGDTESKPAEGVMAEQGRAPVPESVIALQDLIGLTRRPQLSATKEVVCDVPCERCVPGMCFSTARRLQYQFSQSTVVASSTFADGSALYEDLEELPCNPGNPPPGWLATQGRFVAVGGVNTAEDSKYSHSADGFIDFVAARKGGPCQMLRLASLYVCGREFESPLMVHEKAQAVVIVPNEAGDAHFNVDGEDYLLKKGTSVAMFLLPALIPAYGIL